MVVVNAFGDLLGGLYGTVPDDFPTAGRAELWAVVSALRVALPPLTIYVDCGEVGTGWHNGATWCCASDKANADL